jgi:hypothetical protein
MTRIIYGTDTGSIEDPAQCVPLDVPDEVDGDDMERHIEDTDLRAMNAQAVVGLRDVLESLALAMQGEGLNPDMIDRVLSTVIDAVDNND